MLTPAQVRQACELLDKYYVMRKFGLHASADAIADRIELLTGKKPTCTQLPPELKPLSAPTSPSVSASELQNTEQP